MVLNDAVGGNETGRLPRGRAFWAVAYAFFITLLTSTLPTPLYVVYQARWHFPAGVITVIFAAYPAGVLLALLLSGRLSDQVGRRRVLQPALALAVVSSAIFVLARGVEWLIAARVVTGLAVGLLTGAATAALTELEPSRDIRRAALVSTVSTMVGLGLGPLLTGVLAQYAPWPTVLVYLIDLALLAPAYIGVWAIPETVQGASARPALRPQRLRVPAEIHVPFAVAAAAYFSAMAVLGLFTALAPSFTLGLLHIRNRAVGGALVATLFGVSAVAQLTLRRLSHRRAMEAGLAVLVAGLILVVVALMTRSLAVFVASAAGLGLGQGLAFMGSLALVNRLAPPARRAEVDSSYFVVGYLGVALPTLGVGFASERFGFVAAVVAFALAIGALALATAAAVARVTAPPPTPAPPAERQGG